MGTHYILELHSAGKKKREKKKERAARNREKFCTMCNFINWFDHVMDPRQSVLVNGVFKPTMR